MLSPRALLALGNAVFLGRGCVRSAGGRGMRFSFFRAGAWGECWGFFELFRAGNWGEWWGGGMGHFAQGLGPDASAEDARAAPFRRVTSSFFFRALRGTNHNAISFLSQSTHDLFGPHGLLGLHCVATHAINSTILKVKEFMSFA